MINMQSAAAKGKSKNMFTLVRDLGLPGLYKGSAATLLRDIPFSIIFFSMNTTMRQALTDEHGHLPMSKVFFAGITSGSTAAALSTPVDVIKTRLQASAGDSSKISRKSPPVSSSPGLSDAVRTDVGKVTPSSVTSRHFASAAEQVKGKGDKIRYTGIAQCARHIYTTEGIKGFFAGVGPRVLIISPLFGITLWVYDVQRRLQASGQL